ncbi:retron Ec78 anti-phage system effector HNH endonuclease PtuB [Aeromonas salmonicida]|uniref:retron Ec78 anti-phage system effector HNH endonuclease PtuB n=1 Tax=Aeromonas salmonicida TaxID=645 RepID=UPI00232FC031|nr:retron Ec78 anti-phage system effector HNH endonuclease PtuB [Aeromonas salmonicida]WCH25937.1 TIGR02646 family protein [Aeromonas salmonicida]
MKKLDRALATTPVCLSRFHYPRHSWDNVKSRDKKLIWNQIDLIQERFCVYCEMPACQGDRSTGHIEHFYNKGSAVYKHLAFTWGNLFGCCSSTEHCGHFKDQIVNGSPRIYTASLLIKPDRDNPNEYLQFLSTGKVEPKEGVDDQKRQMAVVTIGALNLDCSKLSSSRENVIKGFNARITALNELLSENIVDETEYTQLYLEIKADVFFSIHRTAIYQVVFS